MSSIDTRTIHLDCITCTPPPLDAPAFWDIVAWTGWAAALTAGAVMTVTAGWLIRHMSGGINCAADRTTARMTLVLLICLSVALAGALVGALVPH